LGDILRSEKQKLTKIAAQYILSRTIFFISPAKFSEKFFLRRADLAYKIAKHKVLLLQTILSHNKNCLASGIYNRNGNGKKFQNPNQVFFNSNLWRALSGGNTSFV
jgi:hypothetical protein